MGSWAGAGCAITRNLGLLRASAQVLWGQRAGALQHMTVRRWATALTGGLPAQSGRGVPSPSSVLTCSVGRAGLQHLRS